MSDSFSVISDVASIDLKRAHDFISNSYWAEGIPFTVFKKAAENSICFAVVASNSEQVGFARMITDKATYAYLADVFILESYRGNGLSKRLMQEILAHRDLQGLRRIVLATRDAHGLYHQFGFKALASPDTFMEIWDPEVYK